MNCIVTGGSGFIGSYLVEALINKNYSVTVIDIVSPPSKFKNKIRFVKSDLLKVKKLNSLVKNHDIVFHFAGVSGINESQVNPLKTAEYNIIATINLLQLCKKHKIKRFIFASTVYVNSEQGSFYKSSKRAAESFIEEYQKKYNLDFTILRFGSIYGIGASKENGIDHILDSAIKKNKIIYNGNRNSIREYIHVKDAATAILKALNKNYVNKHVKITGDKKIPVVQALMTIKKELKFKNKIIFDKNKADEGHYIKSPDTYKIKKSIKIKLKKKIPFQLGVREILENKIK
jgi:UDP-glucose 4-epimerase